MSRLSRSPALALALTLACLTPGSAWAAPDDALASAQATIWAKEQAIYEGRTKGDTSAYVENTAKGYVAWPPTLEAPMRVDGFKVGQAAPRASHEKLTMELADFTLQGDVAIIYYRTHRTQLADGSPADDHFDVTHTWVRQNGSWRVLGGMARLKK